MTQAKTHHHTRVLLEKKECCEWVEWMEGSCSTNLIDNGSSYLPWHLHGGFHQGTCP